MQNYYRIRDLREDNDWTQKQVADQLFMQREVYRRYETGEREIPFNIAIAIAKLYNVSLDYLAGLSNDKERKDTRKEEKQKISIHQENNGITTVNINNK